MCRENECFMINFVNKKRTNAAQENAANGPKHSKKFNTAHLMNLVDLPVLANNNEQNREQSAQRRRAEDPPKPPVLISAVRYRQKPADCISALCRCLSVL